MSNIYNIFGNVVTSEVDFPQLKKTSGKPDLSIELGKCPERLDEVLFEKGLFQNNEREFLLCLDGIARFWVSYPENKILVDVDHTDALKGGVQTFLLGSVMSAWVYKKGLIPLHAGLVEWQGNYMLIGGMSGAGKSTTIANLLKRGARVLSDDVTVLDPGNGVFHAGLPYIKLWKDSMEKLEYESDVPTRTGVNKYHIGHNSEAKSISADALNIVYYLEKIDTNGIQKRAVTGLQKVELIQALLYRKEFVMATTKERDVQSHMLKLISDLDCYKIGRPSNQATFDLLINYLND